MYSPTTRLLTILERLQSRRSVTGPELASELEVDIRSIRRYIASLRELGIPIDGESGRAGSYRLRPGYRLPPVMFTNPEMIAVMLGLVAVRDLGLTEAVGAESAIEKVERVLPESLRSQSQAIQNALTFSVRTDKARVRDTILANVSMAAYEQRRLWMDYGALNGQSTQRTVDIYGVTFHGGAWYAVGYCHLRDDKRTFRLDRMYHVRVLEEKFERPANFDAKAFLYASLAKAPGVHDAVILIHAPLEEVQRHVPRDMGTLTQVDGATRWICQVADLEWMARVLASTELPLQVEAPVELRETLATMARRIATMISVDSRQPVA
ncbi:MAG: YafY family transcriptional regulator [Chloroflexota bacterium]|nr:YafY family transcriptional regulator [Chloroflexota bacterium]